MQAAVSRPISRPAGKGAPGASSVGRAIKYLTHYGRQAALPYIFLVIATLAQLAVPTMIRRILDAVTSGYVADQVLQALNQIPPNKIPPQVAGTVLPKILAALHYPATWTQAQLVAQLTANKITAPQSLLWAVVAIVIFAAIRGIFAFLQTFWAEKNSQAVAYDLRNDLYAKIQGLSFSYHDKNQTGQLMIRATDDIEKVRLFIGQGLLQLVGAIILLVGTIIILFTTSVSLAWTAMPILPVALVMFIIFSSAAQPMFRKVQIKLSTLNTVLQENLAGIKVIKAFTREPQQELRFRSAADNLMEQAISVARLFTFLFPVIFLIANLGQAAILYVGGRQIITGALTLGEWQEFSLYLIYLFFPIAQLGFIITQFGQAGASADRIFEILDTKSDIVEKPDAIDLPSVKGDVKFENVTFRYFGGGQPVLERRHLRGPSGRTDRPARRHRLRQEHHHQLAAALLRPQRGPHHDRRPRSARPQARFSAQADRHRPAGDHALQRHHPRQHRLRPLGCQRCRTSSPRPRPRRHTISSCPSPMATTRMSANAAPP